MEVRIAQPLGYSEIGSRSNNEDCLYPDPQYVSAEQKWFIVCDGVGGMERGEVASSLAVSSLDAFFRQQPVAVATEDFIQQGIAYVETQFNRYLRDHAEAAGMATTLTVVYFHEAGATLAHIGDSRIYHIRDGRVIWRTDDHSYVNELLKAGVLSPGEAHRHPQRNVITRALQGGDKPAEASVQVINDLRPGDYFFLCTDGVLERISDELLEGTLYTAHQTNEQKLDTLRRYSLGNTRDNFTAYLIQIEQVLGTVEAAYQIAPPVYQRIEADNDSDESVTLINLPVPESVSTGRSIAEKPNRVSKVDGPILTETNNVRAVAPSSSQPEQTSSASLQAQSDKLPNGNNYRHTEVSPRKNSALRSSRSRLIPVLSIVGLLAGAGGYFGLTYYGDLLATIDEPKKEIQQSAPSVTSALPAKPAHSTAETNGHSGQAVSEERPMSVGKPDGLSVTSEPETTDEAASDPEAPFIEVVKKSKDISIIRDKKTGFLGIQRENSGQATKFIYSSIGAFEAGVATARKKNAKGYINLDGEWIDELQPYSHQKRAARQGNRWGYLNVNGAVSIDFRYDKVEPFEKDGTAKVVLNGKPQRIDTRGELLAN